MPYFIQLPDGNRAQVPDDVPFDVAKAQIAKWHPEFAPKTSAPGQAWEAVKGVGSGLANTLLDIPEAGADLAGYLGADSSGIKGLINRGRQGVESVLGPRPGYEQSLPRQVGETVGQIGSYFIPGIGEEALAAKLGAAGAKAVTRYGLPAAMGAASSGAAGAREAEAAGATQGQQAASFGANAAAGTLFAAIPSLRVLGHTPLGAEHALANYIARSVESGAWGSGIGAVGKAVDNAIASYTYDPKRTIEDGVAASAGLTGAGAGIANALVEAITHGRAAWHDYGPEQRKAYDNQLKQALKDRGLPQAIGLLEYHPPAEEPLVTPPPGQKFLPLQAKGDIGQPEPRLQLTHQPHQTDVTLPDRPVTLPREIPLGPSPEPVQARPEVAPPQATPEVPARPAPPEPAVVPPEKLSARGLPEAELPQVIKGPQEAGLMREKAANDVIELRLTKLAASGAQGSESAASLRALLQASHWSPEQLYVAFKSSETISKMLGKSSDPYGLKFLDRMVRPDAEGKPQEVQGSFTAPTEATKGLVQLSLSPKFLDIAGETAYHEGFHALKSIMAEHDPATAKVLDSQFQDGMTLDQVSGSIRRTLESTKLPGSKESYWDRLSAGVGDRPLPAEEAQAYTFGALADAKAAGAKPTGLAAPAIRFLNFMTNLKERLGNSLRGDGYRSVEDIYGQAARGEALPEGVTPSPGAGAEVLAAQKPTDAIKKIADLQADRSAEERGEKVPGSPASSFEELAKQKKPEEQLSARKSPSEDSRIEAIQNAHLGEEDTRSFWDRLTDYAKEGKQGLFERAYQKTFDAARSLALVERQLSAKGQRSAADLMASTSAYKAADFAMRSGAFSEAAMAKLTVPTFDGKGFSLADESGQMTREPAIKSIEQGNLWRQFRAYYDLLRDKGLMARKPDYVSAFGSSLPKAGMTHDQAISYYDQKYPFFQQARSLFDNNFKGMTKFLADTGVISPDAKKIWDSSNDYIGFFREVEDRNGETRLLGPTSGAALTSKPTLKKIKGSEDEVTDFWTAYAKSLRAATAAGMKNVAANRAIRDGLDLGIVKPISRAEGTGDPTVVSIRQGGTDKYYRIVESPDTPRWLSKLYLDTLTTADMSPASGFTNFLRVPAQLLRTLTVQNPGFALFTHPIREAVQSWVVYPGQMVPLHNAIAGEISLLRNGTDAKRFLKYNGKPAFDFQRVMGLSGESQARTALRSGMDPDSWTEGAVNSVKQGWQMYERLVEAGDRGTRLSIFNAEMAKHGDPYEASWQATNNAVNYSRHGSAQWLRTMASIVPFMNARLQGMDVVNRALARDIKKPLNLGNSWVKAGALMTMSGLLYSMVRDNETYKNLPQDLKDLNWIVPIGKDAITIPIPFEAGLLFKTIPEHLARAWVGDDTPADTKQAVVRALYDVLRLDPMPQLIRPAVDVLANRRALSGTPIVSQSMQGLPAGQQYNSTTSEIAKAIAGVPIFPDFATGKTGEASPAKVDYLLRGYLGTIGSYALTLSDYGLKPLSKESPGWLSPSVNDIPVVGRILRDPSLWSSPAIEHFYNMRSQADELDRAFKMLMARGQPEAAQRAIAGQEKLMAAKPALDQMASTLAKLNAQERMIRMLSPDRMGGEDKRQALENIESMKRYLAGGTEQLRREVQ